MTQITESPTRVSAYAHYAVLRVEIQAGVATVWLRNPPINLYDEKLVHDVSIVGRQLAEDDAVRVVVVRSEIPGFFIAHADATQIEAVNTRILAGKPLIPPTDSTDWAKMLGSWRSMPKPTIAVIEGRVAGGGNEFALSCDMQFASAETAVFNQWEVSLGIVAGAGGLTRLSRVLGRNRAMEAQLACDDFDARTAELYGWINRAIPAADLDAFIDRLTTRIAGFPATAVAAAKQGILDAVAVQGPIPTGDAEVNADLATVMPLLAHPETGDRVRRFLSLGGQTVEGEMRFGALIAEI